jgi:hypothetical protein
MRALISNNSGEIAMPENQKRRLNKGNRLFPFLPIGILLILLVFAGSKFWERFYNDPNLDRSQVEKAQREAEEIAKRYEVWIQYVLVADYTAKRPCLRCPFGLPTVTVKTREIYKHGTTTQYDNKPVVVLTKLISLNTTSSKESNLPPTDK